MARDIKYGINDNVKLFTVFKFYKKMLTYKLELKRKDSIKKLTQEIGKGKGIEPYKLIKTVIRIYYFFNCDKLRDKGWAFLYCNISFREFNIIIDNEWSSIAKKYEFENEYFEEIKYWRIRKSESTNTDLN
jgi:hypothetical protein